jgi:hypothetical protein
MGRKLVSLTAHKRLGRGGANCDEVGEDNFHSGSVEAKRDAGR